MTDTLTHAHAYRGWICVKSAFTGWEAWKDTGADRLKHIAADNLTTLRDDIDEIEDDVPIGIIATINKLIDEVERLKADRKQETE